MTAAERLESALAAWDAQCLRRTGPDGKPSYDVNRLPTHETARRLEEAHAALAAELSLTATELRVVLAALRRIGFEGGEAIVRTVDFFALKRAS